MNWRERLAEYIREQAKPVDKYGHQVRLYALTREVGAWQVYDDDVVYAAAWLHDLGVFIGHRPEDLDELVRWDSVAYAMREAPGLLEKFGFPSAKIDGVVEAIRTHQPSADPLTIEGLILRDADILEQLGAVGILRAVSKIGRDTRYPLFAPAASFLTRALHTLPGQIRLDKARELAEPKIAILNAFLQAAQREGVPELF